MPRTVVPEVLLPQVLLGLREHCKYLWEKQGAATQLGQSYCWGQSAAGEGRMFCVYLVVAIPNWTPPPAAPNFCDKKTTLPVFAVKPEAFPPKPFSTEVWSCQKGAEGITGSLDTPNSHCNTQVRVKNPPLPDKHALCAVQMLRTLGMHTELRCSWPNVYAWSSVHRHPYWSRAN